MKSSRMSLAAPVNAACRMAIISDSSLAEAAGIAHQSMPVTVPFNMQALGAVICNSDSVAVPRTPILADAPPGRNCHTSDTNRVEITSFSRTGNVELQLANSAMSGVWVAKRSPDQRFDIPASVSTDSATRISATYG